MSVQISGAHSWPSGPFSAVRPGEVVQEPVESAPAEPVDEMVAVPMMPSTPSTGASSKVSEMMRQGQRAAAGALAAFPQVVHVLADPELHLGAQVASETGLPVLSLEENSVEELAQILTSKEFSQGFILEGFPMDKQSAEGLDTLLSATGPTERRVLGWQMAGGQEQEIVDHYIDQGLLWSVPSESPQSPPDQVKSALLDCLVGLPARK